MDDREHLVGERPAPSASGLQPGLLSDDETLGKQALQVLEAGLLSGQLLPGEKITLRGLAKTLGISMQPVREAVNRLVASNAIEIMSNRTFRVPALDREVSDEVWSMRRLLEGEAVARFAARSGAGEEVRSLFEFNRELRAYPYGADITVTMNTSMSWNVGLAQGSASPLLIDMISNLRLRYAPTIARALLVNKPHDPSFLQFTMHIQDELLLAIEEGDAEAARNLRCADIRSFQRYLYDRLNWPTLHIPERNWR